MGWFGYKIGFPTSQTTWPIWSKHLHRVFPAVHLSLVAWFSWPGLLLLAVVGEVALAGHHYSWRRSGIYKHRREVDGHSKQVIEFGVNCAMLGLELELEMELFLFTFAHLKILLGANSWPMRASRHEAADSAHVTQYWSCYHEIYCESPREAQCHMPRYYSYECNLWILWKWMPEYGEIWKDVSTSFTLRPEGSCSQKNPWGWNLVNMIILH